MNKKIISVLLFVCMIFTIVPVMAGSSEEKQEVLERFNSAYVSDYEYLIEEYHSIIFEDESVYYKYEGLKKRENVVEKLYTNAPFRDFEELASVLTDLIMEAYNEDMNSSVGSGSIGEDAASIGIGLSEVSAKAGETVEITLDITDNTGFVNLGLEISYDSSVMTLLSVGENEEVGAICTMAESIDANPYNIVWDSASDISFCGTLATFTFKIADDAPEGDYPVDINFYGGRNGDYIDGDDVNYDGDENPLNLSYECGMVNVYTHIAGDIDGDGVVNNKDATCLLRYLSGWNIDDINMVALDTTGDGKINSKDGTRLLRHLAGWDVEIY